MKLEPLKPKIFLTLPFPPSLNRMYRTVQGRMLISAIGRQFKTEVGRICLLRNVRPLTGELMIIIDVHRPQKRGDLDNFFKGLFDSLNGYAWIDDSQIVEIRARRFDDKDSPRVEVEISEVN